MCGHHPDTKTGITLIWQGRIPQPKTLYTYVGLAFHVRDTEQPRQQSNSVETASLDRSRGLDK